MNPELFANLLADEPDSVEKMLKALRWSPRQAQDAAARAADLIEKIRAGGKTKSGSVESFLRAFGLDTDEGLALMGLAEALLRIPDTKTADRFVRDRILSASWAKSGEGDVFTGAAELSLSAARRMLAGPMRRFGAPVIRRGLIRGVRTLGKQFVMGEDISAALRAAEPFSKKGYGFSFDMLGEGARTAEDAERNFLAYADAIDALAAAGNASASSRRYGVSVKLSALHPRYQVEQEDRCLPALVEKLSQLARNAARAGLSLTVDAEESWRLALSIRIFERVLRDGALKGWEGFGLAVQAYQKRAVALCAHLAQVAEDAEQKIEVRLVKGAYWDSEIKRAQMLGLSGYPVFTRKANTDLSYLTCAQKLLAARGRIDPMFATHNAHSVAAIVEMAKSEGVETLAFQRLHGMGEALHDEILAWGLGQSRIYAPVGPSAALLPYLVRRLLENGASASFVHKILDPQTPVETLCADPVDAARVHETRMHPRIALPRDLYQPDRLNAAGMDLSDEPAIDALLSDMNRARIPDVSAPLIGGKTVRAGSSLPVTNPADWRTEIGRVHYAQDEDIARAFSRARAAFADWSRTGVNARARIFERAADLFESRRAEFMALLVSEAGKTVPDALAELREAVDFCRYYAWRGRMDFSAPRILPGPVGERNTLSLSGRGVFVCISPWNFPLAIFTGQIVAALMAGNAVVAKPAEQTPLIAFHAVRLLHAAGVPADVLALLPGDGRTGARIVAHESVAGVAFTGSVEVSRAINRALAAKDSAIVPLIAETGGMNAMIVDSSALPEQVVDDVMTSAFGSAGQRCSALRILCVQSDIAGGVLKMLGGAMGTLRVDDPARLSTDIGPLIDAQAHESLARHVSALGGFAKAIAQAPLGNAARERGYFLAPSAWEIGGIDDLSGEVFGPVLHVVRYEAGYEDALIEALNATGYGLTFGLHSRIEHSFPAMCGAVAAGNAYINRGMTGAVVGVQPFGGSGLSGTGPKAGGPHYLPRFAVEKTQSVNTAATGGNAALAALEE